jgi:hypothetical protein
VCTWLEPRAVAVSPCWPEFRPSELSQNSHDDGEESSGGGIVEYGDSLPSYTESQFRRF